MKATIELPDGLVPALQSRAASQGSSVQDVIIAMIEREIGESAGGSKQGHRVRLPLIHSASPGSLRSLTNAEIDS